MKIHNIRECHKGWILGDFPKAIHRNQHIEVAHHFHPKGFVGDRHTHYHSTELTYIVRGKLIATGHELGPGDMFIYEPYDVAEVEFLEDTDLVVVKWPSVPNDKHIIR